MTLPQHMTTTDIWLTPSHIIDDARAVMGGIELDPASCQVANDVIGAERFFDEAQDGLAQSWACESLWCNPPYSKNRLWVPRFVEAVSTGEAKQGILLVFANTDVKWFQPLWNLWVCFTRGRIRFVRPDGTVGSSSPKGSAIVYGGPNVRQFAQIFGQHGEIIPPRWMRPWSSWHNPEQLELGVVDE